MPFPNSVKICRKHCITFSSGIISAGGHGILRSMHANPNLVGDIVPVDIVANLMCAVAYKTAKEGLVSGRFLNFWN